MKTKEKLDFAVVILNYNSADLTIKAVNSLLKYENGNYMIFIGDNNSRCEDKLKLNSLSSEKTHNFFLKNNKGYANGNNAIIEKLLERYEPMYIVIMNPDIEVIQYNTINRIINKIDANKIFIGGQPLVWNFKYGDNPNVQINISKLLSFSSLLLSTSILLRILFYKRHKKNLYLNLIPYHDNVPYEVPSGAFFIIKTDIFKQVGFFDSGTFLYYEEAILGIKISKLHKKFILCPDSIVKHNHGGSTNYNRYSFSYKMHTIRIKSAMYYARKYLKINRVQVLILKIAIFTDLVVRYSLSVIYKVLRLFA